MEWTDQEAASLAKMGDQVAFRFLVERHSHAIFRIAFRLTGNEEDAEDLVQETFLRAYKQLHQFDGRAAFGTWLYRICVNCSLDFLRSKKLHKERGYWAELLTSRDPSPERLFQSREIAELLTPAVQGLTQAERTAFLLRHCEGRDIGYIAKTLGINASAAKHSIFRAVQKLRRALDILRQVETR